MQCEYYALEGLSDLVKTIKKVRAHLNPVLEIEGLLRTMFDPRNMLAQQVSAQLEQHFGDKVYRTVIPRNIRLAEAPSYGVPVLYHDKASKGAQAYLALAGEMINRGAKMMVMNKGLGRGLDALLGGDLRNGIRQRCVARPEGGSAAARQIPATHADGSGVAAAPGGFDQGAGHHAADPGAPGGAGETTKSSPANAAGVPPRWRD